MNIFARKADKCLKRRLREFGRQPIEIIAEKYAEIDYAAWLFTLAGFIGIAGMLLIAVLRGVL